MKKILFVLFVACIYSCMLITPALAQDLYKVEVNTALNVREKPSRNSNVIGTFANQEVVKVYSIDENGWAKVYKNGRYGYVQSSYMTKQQISSEVPKEADDDSFTAHIERKLEQWGSNLQNLLPTTTDLTLFSIVVVLAVLVTLCRIFMNEVISDSVVAYYGASFLFLALCSFELLYCMTYQGDITWFCSPDTVGWIWTVVNFVLFGIAIFNQILFLIIILTVSDAYGERDGNYQLGLMSIPIGFVCMIISGIFYEPALTYIVLIILLMQVIQVGCIVYYTISNSGNIFNMLYTIVLYIIGVLATTVALVHFLALLVVFLIGCLVVSVLGSSSRSCCGNCRSYSNGYCYYRQRNVSSSGYCNKYE